MDPRDVGRMLNVFVGHGASGSRKNSLIHLSFRRQSNFCCRLSTRCAQGSCRKLVTKLLRRPRLVAVPVSLTLCCFKFGEFQNQLLHVEVAVFTNSAQLYPSPRPKIVFWSISCISTRRPNTANTFSKPWASDTNWR